MKNFYLFILTIILTIPAFQIHAEIFPIKNWELKIGKIWQPSKVEPWDYKSNLSKYNGFGEYRATVIVSSELANNPIAFYCESIDDADNTYFNGIKIGSTGSLPLDGNIFYSGVRTPRLYIISEKSVKFDKKNTISILVYDYSGNGGFSYSQKIYIGNYYELLEMTKKKYYLNDLPRTVFIVLLILAIIQILIKLSLNFDKKIFLSSLKKILFNLFPISRSSIKNNSDICNDDKRELLYRYTLILIIFITFLIFTFSELTFKYYFLKNEIFWFKGIAVILFIGLTFAIQIYHQEIFGENYLIRKTSRIHKWITVPIYFITHPMWPFVMTITLLILPTQNSWSKFTTTGLMLTIINFNFLFFSILMHLFIKFRNNKNNDVKKILKNETIFRGSIFLTMIIVLIFLISPNIEFYPHLLFVLTIITSIYLYSSLVFYERHHISADIFNLTEIVSTSLFKKYNLTNQETNICIKIYQGLSREEICNELNISDGTLKIHLKSIYAKTIEKSEYLNGNNGAGKMQRLTIFLHNLAG